MSNVNHNIEGKESELNSLFKETLDGLRDDLIETDENVQLYLTAIQNDPGGKEMYGSFYNDALKIKGSARDRFLKFLALIKDRVAKKEDMALKTKVDEDAEFSFNPADLNNIVNKIKNSQGEGVVPHIEISKDEESLFNEDVEEDDNE